MQDSALEDFLNRFGDPENSKDLKKIKSLKSNKLEKIKVPSLEESIDSPDISSELNNKMASLSNEGDVSSFTDKASNVAGKAMGAFAPAMTLIDNIKGGQFNTDPNKAKPGDGKGEIVQGAMAGAELGAAFGPYGKVIGAVGGGLISTFAGGKARREWEENKKKSNLNEDVLAKAKRKNEYAQSEGLESLENLKALRKKQLGL